MSGNKGHITLTDEELLQAYRSSDNNQWLGYLLQRYTALLFGVAVKYLKDKSLAEDAVQQIFLKVLSRPPVEDIFNFKGWLYILMRNHCLQQLRDKNNISGDTALAYLPATEPDDEEMQWREQTLDHMNEAMTLLNEEQRKALSLFYLEKNSYEQIIAKTGYTFMQVKSFIQNGKRNLKHLLLKRTENRS